MKKHKNKIIAAAIIAIILAIAFLWGGNAPCLSGRDASAPEATEKVRKTPRPKSKTSIETPIPSDAAETIPPSEETEDDDTPMTAEEKIEWAQQIAEETIKSEESGDYYGGNDTVANEDSGSDHDDTAPQVRPEPIAAENAVISDKEMTCTLSVSCDTILNNMSWLDKKKQSLVPSDGVIFAEKTVTFYEGESVFNLLVREMKRNKIHMEYTNIPVYNSAYIEGINNIYELDCGELSGWMYKVNGWFPNYGCSRYALCEGDKVEVVYTCNLGIDVGGYYSARNGK